MGLKKMVKKQLLKRQPKIIKPEKEERYVDFRHLINCKRNPKAKTIFDCQECYRNNNDGVYPTRAMCKIENASGKNCTEKPKLNARFNSLKKGIKNT